MWRMAACCTTCCATSPRPEASFFRRFEPAQLGRVFSWHRPGHGKIGNPGGQQGRRALTPSGGSHASGIAPATGPSRPGRAADSPSAPERGSPKRLELSDCPWSRNRGRPSVAPPAGTQPSPVGNTVFSPRREDFQRLLISATLDQQRNQKNTAGRDHVRVDEEPYSIRPRIRNAGSHCLHSDPQSGGLTPTATPAPRPRSPAGWCGAGCPR